MKDNQKPFILNQPLTKVMWTLSLPAIAAMLMFGLNAFMDTVYIGQLMNETALAGVALAYPVTSILMGLGSWAGTGAGNLLSIALGEEKVDVQRKIIPNATILGLIATILFAIPAYIFAEPLIQLMGGSGDVLAEGVAYFKVSLFGAAPWVYGLLLNLIIRGEGRMKTAAILMIYGLVVNLILTPLFIGYFHMGVEGAAWATNIGMLVYSVMGYIYFSKGKASFPANIHSLSYDKSTFQSIVKMGLPGFIMTIMGLIQAIVVLNVIVHVGNESDLAFFAAINRIQLFLMTPLFGLMRALQPVVGINFGAAQYDRVKQSLIVFTKTGFYLVAPFWLMLTIFPEQSISLILPNTAFTAQELINAQIYMLVLPILPIVFMALTFFSAIKEEKYGSIIGLARQLVFYVPAMLILPSLLGLEWVYYGSTAIDFIVTGWIVYITWKLFKKLDQKKEEKVQETVLV